jgi:hypothetical protein
MHRKYPALILVMLFILTVFNSSIVAENDISSRLNRLKITKDLIIEKEKFNKIDDDLIDNCIRTGNYSKLLEFMGENSTIAFNARIHAKGRGLYIARRIRYLKIMHPLPNFHLLTPLPPGIINQWLFYVKFNNDTLYDPLTKSTIISNATTSIVPINGDPPINITGNHSILALVWQFPPINRYLVLQSKLNKWTNGKINLTRPEIFEELSFQHFWNWYIPTPYSYLSPTLFEVIFILMYWPFNFWTSFLNNIWPSKMEGRASFIIWNNSTA